MTKQELLNGKTFHFSNEEHQAAHASDDIRTLEVSHFQDDRNQWRTGFKIEFNGALIHSSTTFKPMEKRLKRIIEDWNLKPITAEDE